MAKFKIEMEMEIADKDCLAHMEQQGQFVTYLVVDALAEFCRARDNGIATYVFRRYPASEYGESFVSQKIRSNLIRCTVAGTIQTGALRTMKVTKLKG